MRDVRFEFEREWINAGALKARGDVIDLPAQVAERLQRAGAGRVVSEPQAAPAAASPVRKRKFSKE
jgi:hypothetical protein